MIKIIEVLISNIECWSALLFQNLLKKLNITEVLVNSKLLGFKCKETKMRFWPDGILSKAFVRNN